MHARITSRLPALGLRPMYAVPELARVVGISSDSMLRALRKNGVEFVHSGRSLWVPLGEIRRKIPFLWEGMIEVERARRLAAKPPPPPPRPARPGAPRVREP
jgi:hypothetical protein